MGFFDKAPSEIEVTTDFLKVLASKTIKLDDKTRQRIGPIILATVGQFLNYEDLKASEIQNSYSMFQIISGTAGMDMDTTYIQYTSTSPKDDLDEIGSLISDAIPIEIPIVFVGPLRHTMVNYLVRDIQGEVERDKHKKEWFIGSDYEILINLIIDVVNEINLLCLTGTFRQHKYIVATLADFTQIFMYILDYHANS